MKNIALLFFAFAGIFFANSAPAQTTVNRTVSVAEKYDAINMAGTSILHFETGPAGQPLTVIGTAEDLDNLEISVKGGTLTVRNRKGYRSKSRTPVQIYAKNPTLKKAGVSGTGTINISGRLDSQVNDFSVSGTGTVNVESVDCRNLTASVTGTGKVKCSSSRADKITASVSGTGTVELSAIEARSVKAVSNGTGTVSLSGTSDSGEMICSGTGSVRAEDLGTIRVKAVSSGTGSIYCCGSEEFDGSASGTGKIYLSGNPPQMRYNGDPNKLVVR